MFIIWNCFRNAKRRQLPLASSKEEEEAERQMEMIWKLGLHYLAFFLDNDDDDNREINAEEGKQFLFDLF